VTQLREEHEKVIVCDVVKQRECLKKVVRLLQIRELRVQETAPRIDEGERGDYDWIVNVVVLETLLVAADEHFESLRVSRRALHEVLD
jgi:hypothetical protein